MKNFKTNTVIDTLQGGLNYTDEGFLIVKANILEVDRDMIYLGKSGEKFIERVTDESLNEKAIKSFVGKTVTIDHPAQRLNAFNLTKYKKGTIIGVEKSEKFLQAQLQIEDPETIEYLEEMHKENTELEVSAGYFAKAKLLEDGTYEQHAIKGNHLALLPKGVKGRAGADVKIKYNKGDDMEKLITNIGEFTTAELVEKVNSLDSEKKSLEVEKVNLDTGLKSANAEIEELKANISSLEAEKNKAEESNLVREIRENLGEMVEFSEVMDSKAMKLATILKTNSEFIAEGKSEEVIEAVYEASAAMLKNNMKAPDNTYVENKSGESISPSVDFSVYRSYNKGGK